MAELPKAENLPREELSPSPPDVNANLLSDTLLRLMRAIQTGEYSPQEHIKNVLDRIREEEEYRQKEIDTYNKLINTPASAWLGNDTPWQDVMWIKASTYEVFSLFDVPDFPNDGPTSFEDSKKYTVRCPGTNFFYMHKTLPQSYSIQIALSRKKVGEAFFDSDIVLPVLYEQMGPNDDYRQRVWMSLSPMEMLTQAPGIKLAKGRCVVGGLGLGWFLKEIAAKPEVTEIVVVESNKNLLDWIKPVLMTKYPEVAKKVTAWVHDNVYNYIIRALKDEGILDDSKKVPSDVMYLLDIWPKFGDVDYDRTFVQLEVVLKDKIWGWGRGATYGDSPHKLNPKEPLPFERAYIRKKPCTGCPFARKGEPDPKAYNPIRLVAQAFGPFILPCHQEPDYAESREVDPHTKAQCAGATIFRTHIGVDKKLPACFHKLPEDKETVYATPAEMISARKEVSLEAAEEFLLAYPPEYLLDKEMQKQEVRVYGIE